MHASCRCKNMVFVSIFLSVMLDPAGCVFDGVHSLNDHCIAVYESILIRFSTFFRMNCPFRSATHFSFSSLDGATMVSQNFGQKL